MGPKISVLIPAYNAEKFIAKTLESVFAQTYPAHEIIVIDDSSTDKTALVLESFKNRIRFKTIPNGGGAAARNAAFEMSTGDYVAYLDHDDLMFKHNLSRRAEMIIRFPDVGVFCCNYFVRYPYYHFRLGTHYEMLKSRKYLNWDAPLKQDALKLLIKEHFVGTPSAAVVKREVVIRVGPWNPKYIYSNDYDYWLRCAMAAKFMLTSEPLIYKKTMAESMSLDEIKTLADHNEILKSFIAENGDYLRSHGLLGIARLSLARSLYDMGNVNYESSNKKIALQIYISGLKASQSIGSILDFTKTCSKKLFRLLSFDLINKKRLRTLFGTRGKLQESSIRAGTTDAPSTNFPRISVLLPVYNGGRMLEKALGSVFAQTYPVHEIIVVDDGSTDDTPKVMAKYAGRIIGKRIPNSGPAAARNEGLKWVTGDAVAFLDHDDIWFKDKLARQAEALRKYPNAGFVCCDFAVRYPHMNYRLVKHFSVLWNKKEMNFDAPLKKNPFRLLLKEHFVGTSSNVVIRKEVIDRVGAFNPNYKSSQDYDYWLRCGLVTDFVVLKDTLLYKMNHPSNISANIKRTHFFRRQLLADTVASQQEAIRRLRLSHVSRMSLAQCDYYRGNIEFETKQVGEAFQIYWQALMAYPHPVNWMYFGWVVLRKIIRLISFNLISRENLRKIFHGS